MNHVLTFLLPALLALSACEKSPSPDPKQVDSEPVEAVPLPAAKTPAEPGEFGPTLAKVEGDYSPEFHLKDGQCAECHSQIHNEWNESVHALASLSNPFYRFSFDVFVEESGAEKTPFCAGCHDPALLFDGAVTKDLDGNDPRSHAGVGCVHCHSMDEFTADGNGSYTLNTSPIPMPVEGDAASLKAHIERVGGTKLRANEMCVTCHRGFMGPHSGHDVIISGLDEWGPFRRSGYAGNPTTRITNVQEQDCVGCHMPKVDGHSSHRFAGGHSALAAMTGSEAQIEAVKKMVENAAFLDITFVGADPLEPDLHLEKIQPGDTVYIDVVIHNDQVGHAFPGGAQDIRDTWLEVELVDGTGRVLSSAGTAHRDTGADPSAHVLQAYMVNEEGERNRIHAVHGFRTPAFRNSIGPKDSKLVRYAWTIPEGAPDDVRIEARLQHRRLTMSFQQATCEHTKRPEDLAFQAGTKAHRGVNLDPCAPQPVYEIASASRRLVGNTDRVRPEWLGHSLRAQALQHHVQESLGESVNAYLLALEKIQEDPKATERNRAALHLELGKVYGRLGRSVDAFDQFTLAENLIGPDAGIHYARGVTQQRVFKLKEASEWFEKASEIYSDDRTWKGLAIARGSAQDMAGSLEAAQKGLAIEPRDADLLRNQMVAYRALERDSDNAKTAVDAFGRYQHDTLAPHIHNKCADRDPECKQGRLPLQTITLPDL